MVRRRPAARATRRSPSLVRAAGSARGPSPCARAFGAFRGTAHWLTRFGALVFPRRRPRAVAGRSRVARRGLGLGEEGSRAGRSVHWRLMAAGSWSAGPRCWAGLVRGTCCSGSLLSLRGAIPPLLPRTSWSMALRDRTPVPRAEALVVPVSEVLAMGQWKVYDWGLWTSHATTFPWHFDDFVSLYVLAGNAVVTPTEDWLFHRLLLLRPGDMVLLPRGFTASWQCFPFITLRWTRGSSPPQAFAGGLPREPGSPPRCELHQLARPPLGPWAALPGATHLTAAPGVAVALPAGPPHLHSDSDKAVDGDRLASPPPGTCPLATPDGGLPSTRGLRGKVRPRTPQALSVDCSPWPMPRGTCTCGAR